MKMNRIVTVLALAFAMLGGTSAWSQSRGHGRKGGNSEFRGLNLSVEQKTQIRTIHQQQRTKLEELATQPLTRAQFRSQAAEIRKSGHDQVVNNVLTADQRARVSARESRRTQGRRVPRTA